MNEQSEVITLCQRIAKIAVGNFNLRDVITFMKHCMVDEALGRSKTQAEAAKLLGISRRIFTYRRGS